MVTLMPLSKETLRLPSKERRVSLESGISVTMEFSMGQAVFPGEAADYPALIRLADARMYEEKKRRKQGEQRTSEAYPQEQK